MGKRIVFKSVNNQSRIKDWKRKDIVLKEELKEIYKKRRMREKGKEATMRPFLYFDGKDERQEKYDCNWIRN